MSVFLPNGATISVASSYAASDSVSGITNADPGVASAAAHGISDGAYVEITSGWSQLNNRIARVDNGDSGTFELEGINTTNTTKYPAGTGSGSVREITGWTQLSQVLSTSSSGGEQQFTNYRFLEDATERRIPTSKSAGGLEIQLADDVDLSWYDLLSTADDDRIPRAVKIDLPSGSIILYNAYITINQTPSLTVDEVMSLQATLSFTADPTRYAS